MNQDNNPLAILLVDDDKTIVNIFEYGLTAEGYEVHTAYNVAEALRVAHSIKIDCLLSDIQLPDQDGITLNSMIKEIYPDIISILMTGYPGISSAIKGLRQNIHDYLIKPFSVEQVIASIDRSLANNRLVKANQGHLDRITQLEEEVRDLQQQLEKMEKLPQAESTSAIKKAVVCMSSK